MDRQTIEKATRISHRLDRLEKVQRELEAMGRPTFLTFECREQVEGKRVERYKEVSIHLALFEGTPVLEQVKELILKAAEEEKVRLEKELKEL